MFYFRYWLYRLVKPFVRPMTPETAFKYHFGALFLYCFVGANGGLFVWYKFKTDPELSENSKFLDDLSRLKEKAFIRRYDEATVVKIGYGGYESSHFNKKEYEIERDRLEKLELAKYKEEGALI